jgi:hypothetical protein
MSDLFGGTIMITLAILSLLTLTIATASVISKKRQRERDRGDIPLFTVSTSAAALTTRPFAEYGDTPPSFETVTRTPAYGESQDPGMRFSPAAPTIRTRDGAVSTVPMPHRAAPFPTMNDDNVGEAVDGASVRYWRAADGTLQFLPGRLVISAGQDAGHEIRFVRTSGPDGTIVTFGRAEGAPYRHVQLREPTVSRLHARMELDQRTAPNASGARGTTVGQPPRWRLDNLSSTNPVIVNGKPLDAHDAAGASVMLSDGDRIEMGEVAFVFHAR